MVKPEWGAKRLCQSCGAKFYDMRRKPIRCPKCDTVFEPESQSKPKRSRAVAQAKKPEPPAKVEKPAEKTEPPTEDVADQSESDAGAVAKEPDEAEEQNTEKSNKDEGVIEDVSELGEDDDDVAEVVDGMIEDKTEER